MAGATGPRAPMLTRLLSATLVAGSVWTCLIFDPLPAAGQAWVGVPPTPKTTGPSIGRIASGQRDPNAQMFVQANEIQYDYTGERVSAVGGVQIHFGGTVLEADRVVYDQRSKRLSAEGNVRLSEPNGSVIVTDRLELDEQLRNGFVDSLYIENADRTRIAARRADIQPGTDGGRLTVFQSGVYTACEPCKSDPTRPPKWRVRAARIVHDEKEKTIYYEDAAFELFGLPIAYFPYFWTPDPTVKKKSGMLMPTIMNGTYIGTGARLRYFWNIAPDYDYTFEPGYLSRQGALMAGEWRQRLMNGAYTIRTVGIFQQDLSAFVGTTGYRDFRGAAETRGDFRLSRNWWFGWDASIYTDNSFATQYKVTKQTQEAVSQAWLFGRGRSSYFDIRAIHIYGLTPLDVQNQLPVLHPLLDYKYRFAHPVFGGELTYNVNMASLTRARPDFDPITNAAAASGVCNDQNPATIKNRPDCILRGMPGTYSRLSSEVQWRRQIVDPFGQIFTPFLWVRGDVAQVSVNGSDPSVGNYLTPGDRGLARIMPAVGIDYRYPLISAHSWGTQTIEPRAQIIVRPSESQIGRFPNEDSQAFLFGDDNLFSISKFPGYDRVEGGGRANVGVNYTAQFNRFGYFNAMFGQSYQLFGANSYNVMDMANAGLNSGLETTRSDYVARMTFQPNTTYTFASRFRFDESTFAVRRLEVEGRVNFDRWSASLTYGQYDSQPLVGLLLPREAILPAATFKLSPNWSIGASALYSIDSNRLNTISISAGYIDECIALSAIYQENYGYRGDIVPNRVVMLQLVLRTLGEVKYQHTVGGPSGGTGLF